jgi:uncharacterized protein YjcR
MRSFNCARPTYSREEIHAEYRFCQKKGLTVYDMATRLGMSPSGVYQRIRYYGWKSLTSAPRGRKPGLSYNKSTTNDKRIAKLLAEIVRLNQQVAKILN